jgi:chromate transporter
VSIGLLLAGALTIGRTAVTGWTTAAIAVAMLILVLRTRTNPALFILAAAIVGVLAFYRA